MDDLPPRWPWSRPSLAATPAVDSADASNAIPLGSSDPRFTIADIRSTIGVVLRHWKLIAAAPLSLVILAEVALHFITPEYRATVQVLVADPHQPTNAAGDQQLSALDVDAAAVSSEIAVMQSRSVLTVAARNLGLDKDPEFNGAAAGKGLLTGFVTRVVRELGIRSGDTGLTDTAAAGDDSVSEELDHATDVLHSRLRVDRDEFSYVLTASIESESPVKAQRIIAAIADTYLNARLEARYEAEQRATNWLSGRLADLRQKVAGDDAAIAKLKADNNLSDTGSGSNLSQQQISDINAQLIIARADAAEKRARLDQVTRASNGGGNLDAVPEVIASPVISQLRLQQAALSQRAAELQSHYGDRYPDLINTKSQLADIGRQIGAEVSRIVATVKNQYDIANGRVQSLQQSLASATGQAGNSQALLQLQDLQRTAEANRKLYEYFLNQYNEIDQRSTLTDTGARIISAATLPREAAYPRSTVALTLTAAAGILIGILSAFLVEYLDSGFKTKLQIEQMLGQSVLGMVPRIKGPFMSATVDRMSILKHLLNEPLSQISETIRSIRLGLALSDVDHPPRVVMVTSSLPNEGKTTGALLLAASAALSQQRTILVDCDLRRRSISAALGLQDKPGLVEVLADKMPLHDVILQDETAHFSILPGGTQALNIIDLLNSNHMHDLIAELRKQYDCVVLDVAPLMAVVDAVVLARLVDKILLVVEWSRTPRATVIDSLKLLNRDAAKLAGVILNKVDFRRLRSRGYGYGYGYNYGSNYRTVDRYYGEA